MMQYIMHHVITDWLVTEVDQCDDIRLTQVKHCIAYSTAITGDIPGVLQS